MTKEKTKIIYLTTALVVATALVIMFFLVSSTIAGWDNFSTNLAPKINFFRTFSAWREYRGLGTPSDSEMSDIFRQLLSYLFYLGGLNKIFDYVWVYTTYILGGFFIYKLSSLLLGKNKKNTKIGVFTAAIFYLFNAHTTSVFAFPLLPLISRFWLFPGVLYIFLRLSEKFSYRDLVFFTILTLLGASSFITGTYFLLILGLLLATFLDFRNIKQKLKLLLIFILINSFWLISFTDYTLRFADKVANSSTFIEVNEIQLNRSVRDFNWDKTLSLYSNFYESNPSAMDTGEKIYLNNLAKVYENRGILYYMMLIFPLFYILGSIKILIDRKKSLYWLPLSLIALIFLAKRESSPIGFLYQLITDRSPSIKILLRFGDTKLHPLIAIVGSVSAGYFVNYLYLCLNNVKKANYLKYLPAAILLVYLCPFYGVLTTGLVSPLTKVNIPKAYYEIAEVINQDKEFSRVLHIPNEKISYWKPYKWGYYGSTFFAYMINKPLVERTFEPGNDPTDRFNQKLRTLVNNNPKDINTKELHNLLASTSIKYLIFDNTVDNKVTQKNMLFWGDLEKENYQAAILKLEEDNYISKINTYNVTINTFGSESLDLYEVKDPASIVESKSNKGIINSEPYFNTDPEVKYITSLTDKGVYFPFHSSFIKNLSDSENQVYQNSFIEDGFIMQDLYAKRTSGEIGITFTPPNKKEVYQTFKLPENGLNNYREVAKENYLEDWKALNYTKYSNFRMIINGIIIPLPFLSTDESIKIGTVVLNKGQNNINVFENTETKELDLANFDFTEYTNCYFDSTEGYNYFLSAGTELNTKNINGTLCISSDLTHLLNLDKLKKDQKGIAEIKIISINDSWGATEKIKNSKILSNFENQALGYLNQQAPNNFTEICIHEAKDDRCINKHQFIKPKVNTAKMSFIYGNDSPINLLISLPSVNGKERKKSFSKVEVTNYNSILSQEFYAADSDYSGITPSYITNVKPVSPYSYYFNNDVDGFLSYTKECGITDSYRETTVKDEKTIMFMQNCNNGLIIRAPYDPVTGYLWTINYNILSGKFPKTSITQGDTLIYNETTSRYSGYPFIDGFKLLQYVPNNLSYYITKNKADYFKNVIDSVKFEKNRVYIEPTGYSRQPSRAIYTVEQNSQGFGATAINEFEIKHIPNKLANLGFIKTSKIELAEQEFEKTEVNYTRISPNWWKLNIKAPEKDAQVLIEFNQSYAKGWKLYKTNSKFLAFFGFKKAITDHVIVDGWKNGYIIPYSELPANYILFYTPERLLIVGFLISFVTLVYFLVKAFLNRK